MYNTRDVGGSWKHYRLSNSTIEARTARAKSPIVSRELDRYYKQREDHLSLEMCQVE